MFLKQGAKLRRMSCYYTKDFAITVCNFQSMKSPVELNTFYQNSFVISPGLLYYLIRRNTRRLANEAFTSNPIVSSKQ